MSAASRVHSRFPSFAWLVPLCLLSLCPARGQSTTGTLEGRVFNSSKEQYVERARITIDGTTLETFSDADGNYRLTNVPAGSRRPESDSPSCEVAHFP